MLLSEQHERKDTEMVFEISKIVNCVYVFEGGSGFVFLFLLDLPLLRHLFSLF